MDARLIPGNVKSPASRLERNVRRAAGHAVPAALSLLLALVALVPCAVRAEAPESGAGATFDVFEFRVRGATAIPPRDIEAAVYPMLGENRSISDVERARDALADLYRSRGYGAVNVDIPEQDVVDGIVRLQVTEGKVGVVRVTGARYFSSGQIRQAVPSLRSGEVVNLPALQSELAAVNRRSPDRTVTPVLRTGKTPGTVDVDLKVKDDLPLKAQLEVNNRYTVDTSHTRLNASVSYGNLFQKFHSLSLMYQTVTEDLEDARVFAATYLAPFGERGDVLAAYYVRTDSDVTTVGSLSVIGAGNIYGMRYVRPLPGSDGLSQGVTLGADYKDFNQTVRLEDGQDQAPISYVNWSAAYQGSLRAERSTLDLDLAANFGLRGFVNGPDEFAYNRYNANPNYFYMRGGLRYVSALPVPGSLLARFDGQLAFEPLISNEQFAVGGAESVRGYLEAEQLGDRGFSASLEWNSPPIPPLWGDWMGGSYGLLFVDGGMVGIIDALPGQAASTDLLSAGVGFRLLPLRSLVANVDWAYPFVSANPTRAGDWRMLFQVKYDF